MLLAVTAEDRPFVAEMLVEAAFPGAAPPPVDPLADDHVARYLDGWGRPGDRGLVAWAGPTRAGAAWVRLMPPGRPGYGFVDADTPELTVAVVASHRGRGFGRALVVGVLDLAAVSGHARVSLSVADANPGAVRLYRSLGFTAVGHEGGSTTMVAAARPTPPSDAVRWCPEARVATGLDGPALLRLRQQMLADMGQGARFESWLGPFLAAWAEGMASGRLVGTVVDGDDGRPVASALASLHDDPRLPGPVADHGRDALVSSVAAEPAWRRRGAARAALVALQAELVAVGVGRAHLRATGAGRGLYEDLGFVEPPLPRLRWTAPPALPPSLTPGSPRL